VLTTACIPKAPSIGSATNVTFSSFSANWAAVTGAIDYRLDVSTSSSFTTFVPGYQDLHVGNVTTYPVTGLNPSTYYYYRVRSYNGCAASVNSSSKSVLTLPCTPAAPSAGSATNVTFSSFRANWSSVSGAIDYRLDVSTSSSFTTYLPGYQDLHVGNVTGYNVTGLNPSTYYYYRVRAYNGCAVSANSSTKSVLTLPCIPAAPSAQRASNVTGTSFTANWRSVTGAIDYRLDVAIDSSFINYVPGYQNLSVGNVISYNVTGLSRSTYYYYRVRSYNGCAASANSSVITVQTSQ
jgi:phosphodiesterase/alkaline phosphatase D-like protein